MKRSLLCTDYYIIPSRTNNSPILCLNLGLINILEKFCNQKYLIKSIYSMVQWNVAAVAAYQIICPISRTFLHPLRSRPQARHYPTAGRSAVKGPIHNRTQKSLQVHIKEQMSKDMPKDLGILPGKSSPERTWFLTNLRYIGTLVMPTGAKKPSFLQETRLRWNLEMHRLRTRFEDFRG